MPSQRRRGSRRATGPLPSRHGTPLRWFARHGTPLRWFAAPCFQLLVHAKVRVDVHGARFGLISELTAFSFSEMPLRCVVPSHYIDRAQHRNSRRSLAMLMQERTAASASHTAYAIANAHAPKLRCRYSHSHSHVRSLSTRTNTSACTQHAPTLCCTH